MENYFPLQARREGDRQRRRVRPAVGDGDPRACYLEIEKNELNWRRIEYDVQAVADKIEANEKLSPAFAQRLVRGF